MVLVAALVDYQRAPNLGSSLARQATAPIGGEFNADLLLLVTMLLGLVAMAALAGVVSARREARDATRIARARARSLNELLRTVRMAESIADLGIWQYDPNSGQQQTHPARP